MFIKACFWLEDVYNFIQPETLNTTINLSTLMENKQFNGELVSIWAETHQ